MIEEKKSRLNIHSILLAEKRLSLRLLPYPSLLLIAAPTLCRLMKYANGLTGMWQGHRFTLLLLLVVAVFLSSCVNLGAASPQAALRGANDEEDDDGKRRGLQVDALREKFQTSRARYYEKLHQDYGEEYTAELFLDQHPTVPGRQTTVGRTMFWQGTANAPLAWDRLVRKMTYKLIDAHLGRRPTTTFVWATGGHSAAAGHGNFFAESYTNVLDRHAKPVFAAVGIDFKARSNAMGGTQSATEIAACAKEVRYCWLLLLEKRKKE